MVAQAKGLSVTLELERLTRRQEVVRADLLMKAEIEDWHGVADAAMDLREIDVALKLLTQVYTK